MTLGHACSIIKQSYDAKERIMDASLPSHLSHGNLNGDGFGIGATTSPACMDIMCCPSLRPPYTSLARVLMGDGCAQPIQTWNAHVARRWDCPCT